MTATLAGPFRANSTAAPLVLLAVALLAGRQAMPAQPLTPPADAQAKVDQVFSRFQKPGSPGCAVGVGIGDAQVLAAAYGSADLEHGVALTPESVFEPGSIAKQFTAAAVLLLAERGKLSLDDPVRKYIPEVPEYKTPITIRHLLNHTSGLRDWGNLETIAGWPRTSREYTMAHVLEIIGRQQALNYSPGAEYSYTNSGYNLAAILVTRVSGMPFPEFTKKEIFTPLGMTSTQWRDDFRRVVHNRAVAYSEIAGDHLASDAYRQDMPFEDIYGNGGLLTTVGDLLRWNRNFTNAKVGGRALIEAQLQPGKLSNGQDIFYASGLMIPRTNGIREVSHSGSTAGYNAWLGQYPEKGLSVAVITLAAGDLHWNGMNFLEPVGKNEFKFGIEGAHLFFSGGDANSTVVSVKVTRPADEPVFYYKVETAHPTRTELEGLVGEYASDEAEVTFKVAIEGDHLVIHRRPDTTIPLTPTYRDGFTSSLGSVRFLRDADGLVSELSVGDPRVWDLRFRKIP